MKSRLFVDSATAHPERTDRQQPRMTRITQIDLSQPRNARITRINSGYVGLALVAVMAQAGCRAESKAAEDVAKAPAPTPITVATAIRQPIARYLRATGSLVADEQAEVSAEIAGRVTQTPVERGTRVVAGAVLARISATEAEAQLQEAEANAAQIEARLGLSAQGFDPKRVPEVLNAKAALDLAEADFNRIKALLDERVVSQSEFDRRRTQFEAARQQCQVAQNAAEQAFRSLEAARARVALARKALADTTVRAPFAGLVAERLVSTGDYVTKGMKVATVVRIDPLRVELSVPEQFVALVRPGLPVTLTVDAYPDRTFDGRVRFVSPSVRPDQRALTVEAIVPNGNGQLKPGLFATAAIARSVRDPAVLVPAAAIQTTAGTSRVFVVRADRVEERLVTIGERVGDNVEVVSGVAQGEVVAVGNVARLSDGASVTTTRR